MHILLHLHVRDLAEHNRRQVRRRGGIRIPRAGIAPKRLVKRNRISGCNRSIFGGRIQSHFLSQDPSRIGAANARRHGKQLAELNIGLPFVFERKRLGRHVALVEDSLLHSFRNSIFLLAEHDANRNTRVGFAAGSEFGRSLAISAAEVALVYEPSVPRDQKSAVLAGVLGVVKRLVQFGGVDLCCLKHLSGLV